MEEKKRSRGKALLHCTGFIALFLVILTVLSLIYVPKWRGLDAEEMRGLYQEEENSIDMLMLGSCNMYSSFSPVVAYEKTGLTSYVYACPDQELVISYHYLLEALKTQDIKMVVLESLFLTCEPTAKREYYNRTALEYMRPSLNKAQLILKLGAEESEYMQSVDSSAPGKLLTCAGYFFPLLRYHGREDLTMADIEFHLERDDYSEYKGGKPLFSYLQNDTLNFSYVLNGDKVREESREYFIKIKELCEEKGIEFLLVKSPNHYRWDDEATEAVRALAEEQNVPFLDFFVYDDFVPSDYSTTTGRLNIHGMKKFTEHLCEYLDENYEIEPHVLSSENKAKWDACVAYLHEKAAGKNMTIDDGEIYRIYNERNGISLLWNACADCERYDVYRCEGKDGTFRLIETVTGSTYVDESVEAGKGYSYYIVPKEGELADQKSASKYYVFVDAPANGTGKNKNGTVALSWEKSAAAQKYDIQRKKWDYIGYSNWDKTEGTKYTNLDCDSGMAYYYRIRATVTEGETTYYSASEIIGAMPLVTPQITTISTGDGTATIKWNKIAGSSGGTYQIYRRSENQKEFKLYDTIKGSATSYKNMSVEKGVQYYYRIVLTKTTDGVKGISNTSNTVGVIVR